MLFLDRKRTSFHLKKDLFFISTPVFNKLTMKNFICIFCFLAFVSFSLQAQEGGFTSHDIFKINSVSQTVVSPDGKHIAYTVSIPRPFTDKPGSSYKELYILNLKTGESKKYITGKKRFSSLSWHPESNKVSFLAKWYKAKKTQLFTLELNSDSAIQATNSDVSIGSYQWNPKNNSIAYLATEKDTSRNYLVKKGFNQEVYEEGIPHKNLYIYDLSTQQSTQITSDITVYGLEWNPSGDKIAIQSAKKNLTDDSYMFKKIYLVDPNSKEVSLLVNNEGKLGNMSWSPDGKHLAFISGVNINDPVSGSLFVIEVPNSIDFSKLLNQVEGLNGSVTHVEWKDEKTILYSADESVDVTLTAKDIVSGSTNTIIEKETAVFSTFSIGNQTISFAGNTSKHPSELFCLDLKKNKLEKKTDHNEWIAQKSLAKQEKMSYKSRDGLLVEGVLIYPLDYKEGERYPMINYIHGGPEACVKNGWSTAYSMWGQVAAAKGYFVYMPNYRGSSGRGVGYSKMDQGDMGDEEFNDVLDGIDLLIEKGYVDKERVGIGGGSYGGYFSAWAATKHSQRFAASCVFVGISDQVSKRYTTDIPYESYYSHWTFWTHENFDLVFDRSPVKYATNNQTPTLILHGKNDPRVHPSQALELYRSIKLHGKAPVRLIWYPGEGHGNRKAPAQLDYNLRTFEWFDYYLKGNNPKTEKPNKDLDYGIDFK